MGNRKFCLLDLMQMTVTWTSGYNIDEAVPFVEWGLKGESQIRSPSGTLTFTRETVWYDHIIDNVI